MIILTTLKQKDLSAVTAEQLLMESPDAPIRIGKYECYQIQGTVDSKALQHAIQDSYIFSNPNKHHLIMDASSPYLYDQTIYIEIIRKTPLNLTSKVIQLNKQLNQTAKINTITMSDIWSFKYSIPIDAVDKQQLIDRYVVSSASNQGPFAHPLIHTAHLLTFDELTKKLDDS